MPERVLDLPSFLKEVAALLGTVAECRAVLFRKGFRELAARAIEPARGECERIALLIAREDLDQNTRQRLHTYGLDGAQLEMKLDSFEYALSNFEVEGGETNLQDVLDRANIILGSLGGAIPIFGPLAKELIEFFNKELRRRFRNSGIG